MKRVFVAVKIEPQEKFREIAGSMRSDLEQERIKWIDINNIHITLAFLGNMDESSIGRTISILEKSLFEYNPFTIKLSGAGLFRNLTNPRIIWIGISDPEYLNSVRETLCRSLTGANLYSDNSGFKAHITIGRIKSVSSRHKLGEVMMRYRNTYIQEQIVNEIILFESILRNEGPVYLPIQKFRLQNNV